VPPTSPLDQVERALRDHFGAVPQRASVSFVGVEPIDVLRFEPVPGEHAYVTLGMSRHPMTGADELVLAADGPRAELVLQVRDDPVGREVWRRLAVLAAAPSVEGVVHRPGATVGLGEPVAPGSSCTGFVIAQSAFGAIGTDAGPVDMLDVLPATEHELAWARVRGGAALRERWATAGTELGSLTRASVPLD
jgi:hypothetical protein